MSTLAALFEAINVVAQPTSIILVLLGVVFGVIMGILPGLSGVTALALLIPLTFGMEPILAFVLLGAAKGGTAFGGSITAILVNTPGSSANAATLLDGYPLARQGRGGEALGASATASAAGAIIGIGILVISIPILRELALLFGAPEIFLLGLWGVTVIAVVVKGSLLSGLLSGVLGLLFAVHGRNIHTGTVRWDYGQTTLIDGIALVPALIGLFAVAEMIKLVSSGETISKEQNISGASGGKIKGVRSVYTHRWLFFRSSLIGCLIGIVPGAGGSAANFIAYFQAVKTTKNPESYGTGDIRGVIASEASNDAKDGGSLIPTLALGVPGSAAMAVLLGAFTLHGITPGPVLFEQHLDIVMVIMVALVVSNILSSSIGIVLANHLAKLTKVDINIVSIVVLVICFFGAYAVNMNINQIFITLFFGVLGFIMVKIEMSRVPLILGLVLGPIVEENFFRSLHISRGDYGIFFRSPIAIGLLLLIVLSIFLPYIRNAVVPYMRTKIGI